MELGGLRVTLLMSAVTWLLITVLMIFNWKKMYIDKSREVEEVKERDPLLKKRVDNV